MLVDFLNVPLSSERQTAWPGCHSWGEANSCGLTGAPATSAGVLQLGGQALSAAARLPEGPGANFVVLTSRTAGLTQGCLGSKDFSYIFCFESLWVFGGWNNEHQHPPLGCGSLMTDVCSAHCPLPWVAVGKTSDLTPLPLSYTLSEHRAALFFLSSTLVWHPELPHP